MNTPIEFVSSEATLLAPAFALTLQQKEEALAKRFQRKGIFERELVFELSREPAYLHQYYRIRANLYNSILGLTHYPESETEYDRTGYIMIVRMGNFCIGGIRLDTKSPRKPKLLPMETGDFRLEKHFPYLRDKQMTYGQISGLALLPQFHGSKMSYDILARTVGKAISLNAGALFATCPKLNARLYRQYFVAMGHEQTIIHYEIDTPDDPAAEGMKLYTMSSILNKELFSKHHPELTSANSISAKEEA